MIADEEYGQPAHLTFHAADPKSSNPPDWDGARQFTTLREAVHFLMEEEGPPGAFPWILTASGRTLRPEDVTLLLNSSEGP